MGMKEEFKKFINDFHANFDANLNLVLERMRGYLDTEAVVIKDATMYVHMIAQEVKQEMDDWFDEEYPN